MQELYYTTPDTALALALSLAGGELVTIRNEYSPEQLGKLGGTARQAWENGIPGKVTYYFEPTDELKKLVAAWRDETQKLKTGNTGSTLDVTAEDVVRITAACLTQRKAFVELWKQSTPLITVPNSGDPQRIPDSDGIGYTLKLPGFKTISINASEETKRQLNEMP